MADNNNRRRRHSNRRPFVLPNAFQRVRLRSARHQKSAEECRIDPRRCEIEKTWPRNKLLALVFAEAKVTDAGHQVRRVMVVVVFDLVQRDELVVERIGRLHVHRRHHVHVARPGPAHLPGGARAARGRFRERSQRIVRKVGSRGCGSGSSGRRSSRSRTHLPGQTHSAPLNGSKR